MKSFKRQWVNYLVLAVLLFNGFGCSTATTPISITSVPDPTHSVVTSTPIQSSLIPESTIPFVFDQSCWPIKPLKDANSIKGSLVFSDSRNDNFAWDINSFRARPIKNTDWSGLYVSYKGDAILSLPWNEYALTLILPDHATSFSLPKFKYGGTQYLPDGRIWIGTSENILDSYKEGVGITDKFYILDPATGIVTPHSVFFA